MNKKLGLAVAGAVMAFASSAQAGITIPAGDWTLDVGGVVNAYITNTKTDGVKSVNNITTGLLPNVLAVSGKTRQNDLDVAFTISIQPGAATSHSLQNYSYAAQENRQAFLTFGDASWGSVKLGKDLGIYASDAILNDMTLLGVGAGASGVGTTTLGRIGGGYIYADWKSQVAYTSPNWNGFQFTAGVTQSWDSYDSSATTADSTVSSAESTLRGGSQPAYEGKVSYSFTADQVTGKVWASAISQKLTGIKTIAAAAVGDQTASAWDIGANVNVAGFGLTGYYGQGEGLGTVVQFRDGLDSVGKKRDSEDWYVQGTYTVPTIGTKLGASYGESKLDRNAADSVMTQNVTREQWTVGAYHPLTKSVNLVAEYTNLDTNTKTSATVASSKTVSLGAILFF